MSFFASRDDEAGEDGAVAVDPGKPELREPPKFAAVLHNDDYSTMEFVVEVLQRFFRKTAQEATELTLRIHHQGSAVAGIYSRDIAETKALQVTEFARAKGHPLRCTAEPV